MENISLPFKHGKNFIYRTKKKKVIILCHSCLAVYCNCKWLSSFFILFLYNKTSWLTKGRRKKGVKEKHTATLKTRQQRRRSKWKGEERKPRKKQKITQKPENYWSPQCNESVSTVFYPHLSFFFLFLFLLIAQIKCPLEFLWALQWGSSIDLKEYYHSYWSVWGNSWCHLMLIIH